MPMPRPPTVMTRTTYVGVSELARETGLSQGYISRLMTAGWPEHDIREKAERTEFRRELRARRKAERERFDNTC
jgi:hypothetical protein